jgi:hypothetical protein
MTFYILLSAFFYFFTIALLVRKWVLTRKEVATFISLYSKEREKVGEYRSRYGSLDCSVPVSPDEASKVNNDVLSKAINDVNRLLNEGYIEGCDHVISFPKGNELKIVEAVRAAFMDMGWQVSLKKLGDKNTLTFRRPGVEAEKTTETDDDDEGVETK